jgi:hypothetical protein
MFRNLGFTVPLLLICGLYSSVFAYASPGEGCQAAQPPEKTDQKQHQHGHQMNVPSGSSQTCEPKFTYDAGPRGPENWGGVCNSGHTRNRQSISQKPRK